MIRSLLLLFVYVSFLGLSINAPFVATLGYVWVDTFRPQDVSYVILNQVPVALVMGTAALAAYFLLDRRSPPRFCLVTGLQLTLAVWVTLTTIFAELPDVAWEKWGWAFKTLVFSAFIPLVIRSRAQIEAFLQVYMFSLAANLVPFGLKMAISGGGYGQDLSLGGGNSGLAEGSTLAAVSVMTIPIFMYLRTHGILLPRSFLFRSLYLGLAGLAVLTTIGTFERTGLIGLVVLGVAAIIKSRRKILTLFGGILVAGLVAASVSGAWTARISTIGDYNKDSSALARILVWRWTLDYSLSHPLGGGFGDFRLDHIELPGGESRFGVAFHSIYFEVLGEHGWVGLALFVGTMIASLLMLQRTSKQARPYPELIWCRDLASTLQIGIAVLFTCGAFIGIAFQPMIPYMFAMAVSTSEYVRRAVLRLPAPAAKSSSGNAPVPAWRGAATTGAQLAGMPDWRDRQPAAADYAANQVAPGYLDRQKQ